MNNEHDARFDFDVVLVVSLMSEEERRGFVSANRARLEGLGGNANKDDKQMLVQSETKENPVVPHQQRTPDLEMTPDIQKTPDVPKIQDFNSVKIPDTIHNTPDIQNIPDIKDTPDVQKTPNVQNTQDIQKAPAIQKISNSTVGVSEAPVEENPVKREGVLKCKLCSKYIKQSQLLSHRKTHDDEKNVELSNEEISQSSAKVAGKPSDLEIKFDKMMGNTDSVNTSTDNSNTKNPDEDAKFHAQKRKGENSDGDEDWSPKKGKRKQDSDDEDWEASKVKKRNHKSVACAICKKKFSSKFGLTTHERMVHKEKISKNPNSIGDDSKKDEEISKSLESQLSQQRISEVLKRQEGAPASARITRRSITREHSLPVSSPDQKSNSQIQQSVANKNKNPNEYNQKLEIETEPNDAPKEGSSCILEWVSPDPPFTKERSEVVISDLRQRDEKHPTKKIVGNRSELAVAKLKTKPKLPKNVSVTPLRSTNQEAAYSDESLLVDDFDFSEDKDKPLTIDENVETVTVAVEGSLRYFEFGEISQADALLLTS